MWSAFVIVAGVGIPFLWVTAMAIEDTFFDN